MPSIKIRLGGKCNQNCKFCHSNKGDEYKFNPKLIPFIKYNDFTSITYSGGEPLLYWDIIKYMIDLLPDKSNCIVSNGSLFNEEMLDYCIKYNISFAVSLNEYTNIDDTTWELIGKIPNLYTAKVYTGNKTLNELDKLVEMFNDKTHRNIKTYWYNLMHSTCNNDLVYTKEAKDHYINEMKFRLRNALYSLVIHKPTKWSCLLGYLCKFLLSNKIQGCSTYQHMTVSLDGRIMDCSYIAEYGVSIEDIYNYSYPKLYKDSCYSCQLNTKCHSCNKTKNDDQCEIYNELYSYIKEVCAEYNLDIDNLSKYF